MNTLYQLMRLSDAAVVDLAFEDWLASDDCGHWEANDIRDRCDEDVRYDRARDHFHYWFSEWFFDRDDPDGFGSSHLLILCEERVEDLKDFFFAAVIDSLTDAEDMLRTYASLPR